MSRREIGQQGHTFMCMRAHMRLVRPCTGMGTGYRVGVQEREGWGMAGLVTGECGKGARHWCTLVDRALGASLTRRREPSGSQLGRSHLKRLPSGCVARRCAGARTLHWSEPLQMKKQTDAQVAMGQHVRFIVDREEYASKGNLHEPATDL